MQLVERYGYGTADEQIQNKKPPLGLHRMEVFRFNIPSGCCVPQNTL